MGGGGDKLEKDEDQGVGSGVTDNKRSNMSSVKMTGSGCRFYFLMLYFLHQQDITLVIGGNYK